MHEPERQETSLPPPLHRSHRLLRSTRLNRATATSSYRNPIETRRVLAHSLIPSVTYMFPMTMTNPRYHDYGLPLSLVL